jgi:hypothetical protein
MAEKSQLTPGSPLRASVPDRAAMAGARANGEASCPSPWLPIASLLELSRELSRLLVLVQPEPDFQAELYRRLVAEARRQQALRMLSSNADGPGAASDRAAFAQEETFEMMRQPHADDWGANKRWIIGAAAVGSASLLGLLVYVRSRRQGKMAY